MIVTVLFSATELHQLLKIPALVHHYLEHQKNDSEITLREFIKIHYFSGNPIDEDYESDQKLPFKNICMENTMLVSLEPPTHAFSIESQAENAFLKKLKIGSYTDNFLNSIAYSSIWRPPIFG